MRTTTTISRPFLLAGLALGLVSGCAASQAPEAGSAAPASTTGTRPAAHATTASTATLARGASGASVIQMLGKPDRIEAVKKNPAAAIWTYYRPVETSVRPVQAVMQDRFVFDPLNRETAMKTVQEPVQQTQAFIVQEVLVLIMVHDQLSDWRKTYREIAATTAP